VSKAIPTVPPAPAVPVPMHTAPPAPSAPDITALLGDHYAAAIKAAIERSVALSMALGIPEAVAQEAIERALVIVSVGTFQSRVARKTGRAASVKAACREMAAMVETPPSRAAQRRSPGESRRTG
jgi:hypothetical protein